MITALPATGRHFIDIFLVDGKDLADLGATLAINQTPSTTSQHGTGEKQVAAGTALAAFSLSDRQLLMHIGCTEAHQVHSPEFTGQVKHKTRFSQKSDQGKDPEVTITRHGSECHVLHLFFSPNFRVLPTHFTGRSDRLLPGGARCHHCCAAFCGIEIPEKRQRSGPEQTSPG